MGFYLKFFGHLEMQLDGQPVHLPTRKTWALLLVLALRPGWHARDGLADLLWPDLPIQQSRTSLRKAISHLRAVKSGGMPPILAQRDQVQWNPQHLQASDLHEMQALLGTPGPLTTRQVDRLEALLQGGFLEHFRLSGCPDLEHQLEVRRLQVHRMLDAGLKRQVHALESHQLDGALRLIQCRLKLDPVSEDAHLQWMHTLVRHGEVEQARQVHREFCHQFQQELGIPYPVDWPEVRKQAGPAILPAPENPGIRPATTQWIFEPMTHFVGRQKEQAELVHLLQQPGCRLLTLHGPGGVGKTRLACQLIKAPGLAGFSAVGVPAEHLQTLDELQLAVFGALSLVQGDREDLVRTLVDHLQHRKVLLVLDNVEHLAGGPLGPWLEDLLHQTLHLKVVLTSRTVLDLPVEYVYPLSGLDVQVQEGAPSEAFVLLQDRALQLGYRGTEQEKHTLEAICRFLWGNPLALEMVAGWLKLLPPEQVLQQLHSGQMPLAFAGGHVQERHRSMQQVIEHSIGLLPAGLHQLLVFLAIFPEGFTLQGAQWVAGAEPLQLKQLLDASLIHRNHQGTYQMLPLVHLHCRQQWKHQHLPAWLNTTYCSYHLKFLLDLQTHLLHHDQAGPALDLLDQQWLNVREALLRAGPAPQLARAAWVLTQYAELRGQFLPCARLLEGVLQGLPAGDLALQLQCCLCYLYMRLGWIKESLQVGTEALPETEQLDESPDRWALWTLLQGLAACEMQRGQLQKALEHYGKSAELSKRDLQAASSRSLQAQAGFRNAISHSGFALVHIALQQWERAWEHLQQGQAALQDLPSPYWCYLHWIHGRILNHTAQPARAIASMRRGMHLAEKLQYRTLLVHIKKDLGEALAPLDPTEAGLVLQEALEMAVRTGNTWATIELHSTLGDLHHTRQEPQLALHHYRAALACAVQCDVLHFGRSALQGAGLLLSSLGQTEQTRMVQDLMVRLSEQPASCLMERWEWDVWFEQVFRVDPWVFRSP